MRVPNRFFGIRDLTYLKAGIRDFSEKGERVRDCNYERDARFGDFTWRDSGSCSLKNRYPEGPVMKMQNKTQLSGDRHHLRECWTSRKQPLSRLLL